MPSRTIKQFRPLPPPEKVMVAGRSDLPSIWKGIASSFLRIVKGRPQSMKRPLAATMLPRILICADEGRRHTRPLLPDYRTICSAPWRCILG